MTTKLTIVPEIVTMIYGYITLPSDEHQALSEVIQLDHQDEQLAGLDFGANDMYVCDDDTICIVCDDEHQLAEVCREIEQWFEEIN